MKHKLHCNQKLKKQYNKILQDYEKEGIIKKINEVCEPGTSHYLPRRAVVTENCDTSKVRIVFDAFMKQKRSTSFKRITSFGTLFITLIV